MVLTRRLTSGKQYQRCRYTHVAGIACISHKWTHTAGLPEWHNLTINIKYQPCLIMIGKVWGFSQFSATCLAFNIWMLAPFLFLEPHNESGWMGSYDFILCLGPSLNLWHASWVRKVSRIMTRASELRRVFWTFLVPDRVFLFRCPNHQYEMMISQEAQMLKRL